MRAVKEFAHAKINLYLDVTGKRSDGFHDIETVMHTVSLSDTVTVEIAPSREAGVTMQIEGEHRLPADDKNIAVKAAKLYLSRAGIKERVNIILSKNIPIAAGLAGGSSDAAATLRALNRLYNRRFTDRMLLSLAAELGSDVPYCVGGGTALCRGRGELIERLPDLKNNSFVIAVAEGERVSTPAAYASLDNLYSDFDGSVSHNNEGYLERLLLGIKIGALDADALYNVFEPAVFKACFGAEGLKLKIKELGAVASLMSGSGPSVFGVFDTEESAKEAERELLSLGYRAYFARSQ